MAKSPTPAKTSAIDAAPAPTPAPTPWAKPDATPPVAEPAPAPALAEPAATIKPEFAQINEPSDTFDEHGQRIAAPPTSEPPAGTPLTPEELAANSQDGTTPETASEPETDTRPPETPPVEDHLTLGDGEHAEQDETPDDMPTGDDNRPDGFIPSDQTAAGALTPPGGRHPGAPRNLHPGEAINLQDPFNVNGTARNQELLAAGHGIRNPKLEKDPNVEAAQSDAEDAASE